MNMQMAKALSLQKHVSGFDYVNHCDYSNLSNSSMLDQFTSYCIMNIENVDQSSQIFHRQK